MKRLTLVQNVLLLAVVAFFASTRNAEAVAVWCDPAYQDMSDAYCQRALYNCIDEYGQPCYRLTKLCANVGYIQVEGCGE
jgi:hypothetical protein